MDKIKNVAQRLGIITIEDMERYTALELIMMIANKMNEFKETINDQNDKIQYLLSEGLLSEVEQIFNEWLQDGTFDTLINQSALEEVSTQLADVTKKTKFEYFRPEWSVFWKDGSNVDNTAALKDALSICQSLAIPLMLSDKKYYFSETLTVESLTSIQGNGQSSILVADYNNWLSDEKIAISVYGEVLTFRATETYNRMFKDFKLTSVGGESSDSIGISFSSHSDVVASIVNNSTTQSSFLNILISKFDVAIDMKEVWNSSFFNVKTTLSRIGLDINGKTVNVNFTNCTFTSFITDFSTNEDTIGISINSGFHYKSGTEGRPEGLTFIGCLVFGALTDVSIQRALQVTFSDCIIDGSEKYAFDIREVDFVKVSGCYIFSSNNSAIKYGGNTTGNPVIFTNNNIICNGKSATACVDLFVGTASLKGIFKLDGNIIVGGSFGVQTNNLNYFSITNNTFKSNSDACIYVQSGGVNSFIDNNSSSYDVKIIKCHPTATSNTLVIGKNKTNNSKTYASGMITMPVGTNVKTLANPFGENRNTDGIRCLTKVTQINTNYPYTVQDLGDNINIKTDGSQQNELKFIYEIICVPYSAWQ